MVIESSVAPRSQHPAPSGGRRGHRLPNHALRSLVSVAIGATLVVVVLPRVTGTTWTDIAGNVEDLTLVQLGVLTGLWFLGLYAHTFVLTGALPGLSHRQALTLNMTGSAVANVLPFGGALGIALNYAMVRSWRLRPSAFAVYTVVTNLWDVLAKLALPSVALSALLMAGQVASQRLEVAAAVALVVLAALLFGAAAALASPRGAARLGGAAETVLRGLFRLLGSGRTIEVRQAVVDGREQVIAVVRGSWARMTVGMAAYISLQALLLWACLHVMGSTLSPIQVLAGFAVERLLTLAVVTPGGVGIAETGTAALLIAMGGDPLAVATGVLLYRMFIYMLEIPVGGLWLAGWVAFGRRRAA